LSDAPVRGMVILDKRKKDASSTRSHLKNWIFDRDQGETEDQPAGILKYVEDLRRGLNADIGRKDFFEMASNQWLTETLLLGQKFEIRVCLSRLPV
jgi:hypothetical protein